MCSEERRNLIEGHRPARYWSQQMSDLSDTTDCLVPTVQIFSCVLESGKCYYTKPNEEIIINYFVRPIDFCTFYLQSDVSFEDCYLDNLCNYKICVRMDSTHI